MYIRCLLINIVSKFCSLLTATNFGTISQEIESKGEWWDSILGTGLQRKVAWDWGVGCSKSATTLRPGNCHDWSFHYPPPRPCTSQVSSGKCLPPCYILIQETSNVQSQNLESIQETVDTIGLLVVRGQQIATDVVGLIDEWAARFFEELDYINEGENGTRFAEMMRVDLPQVSCSHDNLLH